MQSCILKDVQLLLILACALSSHGHFHLRMGHSWALIFNKQDADFAVLAQLYAYIQSSMFIHVNDLLHLFIPLNFLEAVLMKFNKTFCYFNNQLNGIF